MALAPRDTVARPASAPKPIAATVSSSGPSFVRALGVLDASLLVIGCIVGVGIFRSASSIAAHVPSIAAMLVLWTFGGLLSLCGALCYAELAALFPKTGGDYIYITHIYGRFFGFLFGWTKLFIERTGTIAILGAVFADYFSRVIPYPSDGARWVASLGIVLLTAVNAFGIRWGKYVQNAMTVIKIAALASLIGAGVWIVLTHRAVAEDWSMPPLSLPHLQSLGVGLVFVLWTYGGWTEAAYVAEEVRDPTRNVPRALVLGLVLTTALYALVNWSYLVAMPVTQLAQTPLVASAVMQKILGAGGAAFIALMITCSAFGALNGYILTGGRILYALGQDHALLAKLGRLHPRRRTPLAALWLNAAIAILLVWTKTFDQIATYSTLAISLFFTLAVAGVIILRQREPDRPRPYRAWGYPLTPILFCLTMAAFMADIAWKAPRDAGFGFGLVLVGIPLYFWSEHLRKASA